METGLAAAVVSVLKSTGKHEIKSLILRTLYDSVGQVSGGIDAILDVPNLLEAVLLELRRKVRSEKNIDAMRLIGRIAKEGDSARNRIVECGFFNDLEALCMKGICSFSDTFHFFLADSL